MGRLGRLGLGIHRALPSTATATAAAAAGAAVVGAAHVLVPVVAAMRGVVDVDGLGGDEGTVLVGEGLVLRLQLPVKRRASGSEG